ncbi:MarR family transcriptional regulator [Actinoplanes sp. Pm04-4]|uniref:MarR family transcriptional regulator n=1 Tax=Paractinoplanes pyxinae TaxID=2997416 RepID=A0ABT4B695_9ACTN|nr:MarR family transcriptional regulator [Actinoplanes pyxinae]MCY1142026.1 MarR family transcriptional regulator [Actinoplanes pyxinae]
MTDTDLVDALAQLSFLVQNALAEIGAQHDLSLVQVRLLGVLRDHEPTMQELGRHLGLDKSSISGLVDRAQRRGLVTRTASPVDRRVTHVSITETGQRLATEGAAVFAEHISSLVAGLSAADRRTLTRLAHQVISNGSRVSEEHD